MWEAGHSQADIGRSLGLAQSTVAFHLRRVREPDRRFARRYDWGAVQTSYDAGHTVN
jgi:IS30 family transposase